MQNHDYCYIEIPKEDNKISKYNHGGKSMKVPFINYAIKIINYKKRNDTINN